LDASKEKRNIKLEDLPEDQIDVAVATNM